MEKKKRSISKAIARSFYRLRDFIESLTEGPIFVHVDLGGKK